jgi:predicted ATP-grasp superfamily ATP-dependent carboligase
MKLVGTFQSEHFLPAATGHKGLLTGTLQVWSGESPCGPHEECERLLVIKNDIPIDFALVTPLSAAIAKWAAESGVSLLVGIDSYPRRLEDPDRVLAGASVAGQEDISGLDAAPLDDVIVIGFNAGLVASANGEHLRAVALYGPRESPQSDGKAAAAALRTASRILPRLDLDDQEVAEELDRLEKELERQVKAAMEGGRFERGLRGYA